MRSRSATQQRVDEHKRQIEEESKAKACLLQELQGQRRDNDMLKEQIEDEQESKVGIHEPFGPNTDLIFVNGLTVGAPDVNSAWITDIRLKLIEI